MSFSNFRMITPADFTDKKENIVNLSSSQTHVQLLAGIIPNKLKSHVGKILGKTNKFKDKYPCTMFYLISSNSGNRLLLTGSGCWGCGVEGEYAEFEKNYNAIKTLSVDGFSVELIPRCYTVNKHNMDINSDESNTPVRSSTNVNDFKTFDQVLLYVTGLDRIFDVLRSKWGKLSKEMPQLLSPEWNNIHPKLTWLGNMMATVGMVTEDIKYVKMFFWGAQYTQLLLDLGKIDCSDNKYKYLWSLVNKLPTLYFLELGKVDATDTDFKKLGNLNKLRKELMKFDFRQKLKNFYSSVEYTKLLHDLGKIATDTDTYSHFKSLNESVKNLDVFFLSFVTQLISQKFADSDDNFKKLITLKDGMNSIPTIIKLLELWQLYLNFVDPMQTPRTFDLVFDSYAGNPPANFQLFLQDIWADLLKMGVRYVFYAFSRCAEDNLLEYLYNHPDTLDDKGCHIMFAIKNSNITDYTKSIKIKAPCDFCYWTFPHHFDKIGENQLGKWGKTLNLPAFENPQAYLSSLLRRREFDDFKNFYQRIQRNNGFRFMPAQDGKTVLHVASMYHSETEFVNFIYREEPDLLEKRDNDGRTALHHAVINGHPKVVKFLLEITKEYDDPDYFPFGNTAFSYAVANPNQAILTLFFERKPKLLSYHPMLRFKNILTTAAATSTLSTVEKICSFQDAPDALNSPGYQGKTPLYAAWERGNYDIFKFLLKKGAELNIIPELATLCEIFLGSIPKRRFDIVRLLLDEKPELLEEFQNCTCGNPDLCNALHLAAIHGSLDDIKLLTRNNFAVTKTSTGRTPLDIARERRFQEKDIIDHLEIYQKVRVDDPF